MNSVDECVSCVSAWYSHHIQYDNDLTLIDRSKRNQYQIHNGPIYSASESTVIMPENLKLQIQLGFDDY